MKDRTMRFSDLILMMLVLAFFGASFSGQLDALNQIEKRVELLRTEADSYTFICESFRKSCAGTGFSSLDEWEKCCAAMWPLDSISWCETNGVLCGKWSLFGKECEVYAQYDSSKGL